MQARNHIPHILHRIVECGLSIGTIGRERNSIDYSLSSETIRHKEKELLRTFTGIAPERTVMLNQVHGDQIVEIKAYPEKDLPWIADADGMLTALPGLCLVIRTADCVPAFAFDAKKKILGAVHSGWKGCRLDITGKLIRIMKERGCASSDISLFLLPSIGPQSYRVNEDVAQFFPRETIHREGALFVDLWKSVERSAFEEGILLENIFNTQICTLKNENFFSHRRGDVGRNLNFAFIEA